MLKRIIHSFNKYFLNTFCVSGVVLGIGVSGVDKTDLNFSPKVYILVRKTVNKSNKYVKYAIF